MCQGVTPAPLRPPVALGALLALLLLTPRPTLADEPEYPASRLGVRTAPLLLLSRADVRSELGLTAEQTASAKRTIRDLHVRAQALRGMSGPEIVAARGAIDQAMQEWIDTHLSAEQRTRLAQIDLQWEGPAALDSRPALADALALSPAQRRALTQAVTDRERRRRHQDPKPDDERLLAQRALAILAPEQQERWKAMLGRPFVPQVAGAKEHPPR
jgi:hypothetical protein